MSVLDAELSILDEIDSGLDIDALKDVASAVNGLTKPETATVMVTHYKVGCLLLCCSRPLHLLSRLTINDGVFSSSTLSDA